MLVLRKRPYQSAPIVSAVLLLLAGIYFGGNRDFGAFLLAIVVLPALLLAVLVCLGIELVRRGDAKEIGIAAVIALVSPLAFYASAHLKDRAEFYIWAVTHRAQLSHDMQKDGIIMGWASWGMAGSENDSYLVVDRGDVIGSPNAAEGWRKRQGLSCQIVDTQKMWPKLYIVTTYNCPFDGIPLPMD